MGNICNMFNKEEKKQVILDTPHFMNVDLSNNVPVGIPISYSNEPPPYSTINNPIIIHHQNNQDNFMTGLLGGMILSDILEDTY